MTEETKIIDDFSEFTSWLNTLEDLDETLWTKPIAEGKWSVSEIIAHLMNWDKYLISEVIPSVQNGGGIEFPEFNSFNKKASDYAKSGITQSKLLEETKDTRSQLVQKLKELPTEVLVKPTPVHGVTHDPHTGTPYSLIYIVKEFIEHDEHHKGQIVKFLEANNID